MKPFLLSVLAFVLTFSPAEDGVKTDTRNVGNFDKIHVKGSIDVLIERSASEKVVVSAPEKLQTAIITEVRNGELIIYVDEDKSDRGFWEKWQALFDDDEISVTVHATKVRELNLSGSGNISGKGTFGGDRAVINLRGSGDIGFSFDVNTVTASIMGSGDMLLNANAEILNASIKGSGDMTLKGTVQTLDVSVLGSGDISAIDLKVKYCKASVTGSGDISVFVTEKIDASTTGSGDIIYRGKPAITNKDVRGSGDITSAD